MIATVLISGCLDTSEDITETEPDGLPGDIGTPGDITGDAINDLPSNIGMPPENI